MSHSGAFARDRRSPTATSRVGVDVEEVRPRRRLDALAARVLNDEEHAAWLRLDDADEQLRSFLRVWTAKEAYLKALGIGIATRLRDVPARVDGLEHERARRRRRSGSPRCAVDRPSSWSSTIVLSPLAMSNGGTAR